MQAAPRAYARVTRTLPASAEQVFDAWLDPAWIGTWMFGPSVREETVVSLNVDPTVGGSFSFVVRRQGKDIDHIGDYLIIDRPRRLVFTWAVRQDAPAQSRISVEIAPRGNQSCELALSQELDANWADYLPQTEAAWNKMLDALAKALTK